MLNIMFKRQPTDSQFIFITLILVLLMGVPTFHTITARDEAFVEPVANAVVAANSARTPSSIPMSVSSFAATSSVFTNYDVSCSKKSALNFQVTGGYVQLQGRNCLRNFKSGDIEIINKSNGYTASIFSNGFDKYQTDLIQLQKGENEIAIRYRERSGKSVEEVIRVRSSQI